MSRTLHTVDMENLPCDTDTQQGPVTATSPAQKKLKLDCSADQKKPIKVIDFAEGCNIYKEMRMTIDLQDNVKNDPTVKNSNDGTVLLYKSHNHNNPRKSDIEMSETKNDVTRNAVDPKTCDEIRKLDVQDSSEGSLDMEFSGHLVAENNQSERTNFVQNHNNLILVKESSVRVDLLHQMKDEKDTLISPSCVTDKSGIPLSAIGRGDLKRNTSAVTKIICDGNTTTGYEGATILTHFQENMLGSGDTVVTDGPEKSELDKADYVSDNTSCESITLFDADKQTPLMCVKGDKEKSEEDACRLGTCNVVERQGKQSIPEDKLTCGKHPSSAGGRQTVVYVHSDEYMHLCDGMIRVPGRACMVHRLIEAYGLLKYLCVVPPSRLTRAEILRFHSEEYVGVLERLDKEGEEGYDEQAQRCGLGYDCPAEPGVYEYAASVAGATVTAAQCLMDGKCTVAINWFGGWHHAKKDEASGFCYVNDIVLGILKLREKYQRVLYIDLDLHHGDGVEDAFSATSKVFTVSFHKYSLGFFPGTGSIKDVGFGKGRFFSLNIPLLDGIRDQQFFSLFSRILEKVHEVFSPEVVVCQCGADGLAGDPMNSFNLTHLGLGRCVYSLLHWNLPLLLLGGGGYEHANTARCWTFITSIAVSKKLPEDIPDHQHFTEYGPSYELAVTAGYRRNLNTPEYLTDVYRKALGILQKTFKILECNEVV